MSSTSELQNLVIFFGDANDAIARVYARLEDAEEGLTLSGQVLGPFCQYAKTLPAHVPLVQKGQAGSLLAEAVVPDPCFWTPELPFEYRVRVELHSTPVKPTMASSGSLLATAELPLGIRRLGVRGQDLFLEGKRFVIRGVCRHELDQNPSPSGRGQGEGSNHAQGDSDFVRLLDEFHATQTALCVINPSDALCEEASRLGVLLIAEITDPKELPRLARWSAVGIAVLPADAQIEAAVCSAAPNLLLAQRVTDLTSPPRPWAQLLVCETNPSAAGRGQSEGPTEHGRLDVGPPILIERRLTEPLPLQAARAACDKLQADVAPANFAGYLV